MTTSGQDPIAYDLTEDDLRTLPASLKKKVRDETGSATFLTHTLLLSLGSVANVQIAKRVVKLVADMAAEKRRKITDDQISRLVEVLLEGENRPEVDLDLQRDNAALRADYIRQTPCYTATEIRSYQVGNLPKNPSDPAARWKREKRLFAVPYGNTDLFPAFQFQEGSPHPAVKKILNALPEGMSAWQIALWFASGNGWLDGAAPQSHLDSVDEVVDAAQQLNSPVVG